jgi:hypothetical protein
MSPIRIAFLTFAIAAGLEASGAPPAKPAVWLDQPKPASWNTPGVAIPRAPATQDNIDARCRTLARPAELAADRGLQAQGWDLVGAFQGGWEILVIHATAGYDGMCRPRHFQAFVFVHGAFAGTLSPQPMDSRTDAALSQVAIASQTRLTAEYQRYTENDPLCCPSGTTEVVFEIAPDGPVVRPQSASTHRH